MGETKLEVQPSPWTGMDLLRHTAGAQSHCWAKPRKTLIPKLELSEEARRGVYFVFHGLKASSKMFKCEHYLPITDLSRVPQM